MAWKLKELEHSLLVGSTLVEGSTLTEGEAHQILAGKTVQGHPISEIRELLNYRSSVEWLMRQLEQSPYVSQDLVLDFHLRLFQGFPGIHGVWKSLPNYTYLSSGVRHDYVRPAQVPSEMKRWIAQFNVGAPPKDASRLQPAEAAARLYYEFDQIHPFEDGNGRIGRILIAYWLHWKAGLAWSFRLKDKIEHLRALESGNQGDQKPLFRFFKERIKKERP